VLLTGIVLFAAIAGPIDVGGHLRLADGLVVVGVVLCLTSIVAALISRGNLRMVSKKGLNFEPFVSPAFSTTCNFLSMNS
jgi:hypothetical protein